MTVQDYVYLLQLHTTKHNIKLMIVTVSHGLLDAPASYYFPILKNNWCPAKDISAYNFIDELKQ